MAVFIFVSVLLSATLIAVNAECSENMKSLTEAELHTYAGIWAGTQFGGTVKKLGTAKFEKSGDGLKVTCQCAGEGDTCYLEMGESVAQFSDKNSLATRPFLQSTNSGGKYDLITSPLITCDKGGKNQVNSKQMNSYACYSYSHTDKCDDAKCKTDCIGIKSKSGACDKKDSRCHCS